MGVRQSMTSGTGFHFKIIRVVVASPCRATALPAALRLDTNDFEIEPWAPLDVKRGELTGFYRARPLLPAAVESSRASIIDAVPIRKIVQP
jgi:hypothetical protein